MTQGDLFEWAAVPAEAGEVIDRRTMFSDMFQNNIGRQFADIVLKRPQVRREGKVINIAAWRHHGRGEAA
jgi:hypothetical protein